MGRIRLGPPEKLVLRLMAETGYDLFVETGTYKGGTARWAADHFKQVITIDAFLPRFEKTQAAGLPANVDAIFGDSAVLRPKVLPKKPAIFWLDAHWCGDVTLTKWAGMPECPLMDELKAIRPNDIVLIDDARCFVNRDLPPVTEPAQWPTLDQIKQALPGRYVVVFEDVIILVPTDYANRIRQETNIYEPPQVAVLTSNTYAHCLPAFAYWFNKYWGSSITVMRYDTRPPALPKNFSTFAIGKQDHYTWSSGLRRAVEYWRYDLIILLLEDYWLQACDVGRISKFWRYMQDQPAIAKIDLTDDRGKYPHRAWENDATMLISDDDAPFQTSLQAAIWRKSFLLSCLANNEDPWTFEKH